ncbi:MAG: decaprenyl-phosphate phosphoribosyltransferase, partial [Terracoccus sp.]
MSLLPAHGRLGRPHRSAMAAGPDHHANQRHGVAGALVRLTRPAQWPKNLLVLAAPAAAGVLDQGTVLARTLILLVAFTAASAAVYCVNDARDAAADRAHPVKRHRPVASSAVSPRLAVATATVAATAAVSVAASVNLASAGVVVSYLALSTAYSLRLKHVAVLDITIVATGFVLRALSGAVGNELPVSSWFMLVALFGALYLVTGKRAAEVQRTQPGDG